VPAEHAEASSGATRAVLTVGFLCLCCAYAAWGWSNEISDFGGDSSVYMMAARFYSPFWPHSAVYQQFAQTTTYPPLFPFLIGLLGGGFLAAHLLVIGCLLASVTLLFAWMRSEHLGAAPAACVCLVFALMPGTYLQALNIWSENPYLLFSLLAIFCVARAQAATAPSALPFWCGAASAVACAMMLRTAALPLLAALMLALLLRRPSGWGWLIALACSPPLLWSLWSRLHGPAQSSYLAQWTASYSGNFYSTLTAQVITELNVLSRSWRTAWLGGGGSGILLAVCIAAAVMMAAGALHRMWKLRFDGLYVAIYVIELLVWPFPAEAQRLSYVVIPVLLAQSALWAFATARRSSAKQATWLPGLAVALMLIVTLPTLFLTARRFAAFPASAPPITRHIAEAYSDDRRLADLATRSFSAKLEQMKSIGDYVPADGCVFSIKPSIVALYSGRLSVSPPGTAVGGEAFAAGISRCRYAYLMDMASPSFQQAFYPAERLGQRIHPLSIANDGTDNGSAFSVLAEIDP
jgi:hypothetical protein